MPYRLCLKLAAIATAVALVVAAIQAWRADRRDRAQLAAELAATKQLLTAADARQRDRDNHLAQALAAIDAQKRAIRTPAQIVRELQKNIPLPVPLTLDQQPEPNQALESARGVMDHAPANATITHTPDQSPQSKADDAAPASRPARAQPQPEAPSPVLIPRADLKPLYDFTLDCQACQARLSAAQSDLADEKTKTAALAKERDQAIRIAKGGSAWRRIARAAKWFALGAAAGAIAAKTAH